MLIHACAGGLGSVAVQIAKKRTGVRYVWMFMRPDAAQLDEVTRLVEARKLRPVIHRVYPLADVTAAYEELARGRSRGEIVVHVS